MITSIANKCCCETTPSRGVTTLCAERGCALNEHCHTPLPPAVQGQSVIRGRLENKEREAPGLASLVAAGTFATSVRNIP